ncbi:hypothetical protein [Methylacidimicrobium sp. B4]|uniref:hypothetical protein n=1 Tax=Methylacidimicrobium sp. B4 TaxID=2796139 RepID=UPI001A8FA1DA|nr:hypothetical protein [Methylacidimicrobium sp. B4]QSR85045.1 hypothetical protein MacB4_01885 [Methylacidimicrobium sp. B4]
MELVLARSRTPASLLAPLLSATLWLFLLASSLGQVIEGVQNEAFPGQGPSAPSPPATEPSLPPSPRPPEISTEDWQKIFGGEAQVIAAQLKAANGITYYEFRNWDPLHRGIGGARTYVLVENREVRVPWRIAVFGDDAPPWVRLGLSFPEAVAMEKQVFEKYISCVSFFL